jgi:hypothetical protein
MCLQFRMIKFMELNAQMKSINRQIAFKIIGHYRTGLSLLYNLIQMTNVIRDLSFRNINLS